MASQKQQKWLRVHGDKGIETVIDLSQVSAVVFHPEAREGADSPLAGRWCGASMDNGTMVKFWIADTGVPTLLKTLTGAP